eukprot:m.190532 g.190532  ORF g.190532 m.190532 type:complete len:201 (-) comp18234_c1_seq2:70-672(-)
MGVAVEVSRAVSRLLAGHVTAYPTALRAALTAAATTTSGTRDVPCSAADELLGHQMRVLLQAANLQDWDVGISCVSDSELRDLNREYRAKDEATDILSFACYDLGQMPGQLPQVTEPCERNLGDLFLGFPYVANQALDLNQLLFDHTPVLLCHGLVHLQGFDHETQAQRQQMHEEERKLLSEFNVRLRNDAAHRVPLTST